MDSFGRKFRVSIFGESHGTAIGVVLDGVQPGLPLTEDDFVEDILRRKSGPKGTTPRIETDEPEILSGVYNGHTTGAPLAVIFHNRNTRSGDYKLFNDVPRPGHADYTASVKWLDFNDPRGGGTSIQEVNRLLKQFEGTRKLMKGAMDGSLAARMKRR